MRSWKQHIDQRGLANTRCARKYGCFAFDSIKHKGLCLFAISVFLDAGVKAGLTIDRRKLLGFPTVQIALADDDRRFDSVMLGDAKKLVQIQQIGLRAFSRHHRKQDVDVGHRRTDQQILPLIDAFNGAAAFFPFLAFVMNQNLNAVADCGRYLCVAKMSACAAKIPLAVLRQYGVQAADAFDDDPFHARSFNIYANAIHSI